MACTTFYRLAELERTPTIMTCQKLSEFDHFFYRSLYGSPLKVGWFYTSSSNFQNKRRSEGHSHNFRNTYQVKKQKKTNLSKSVKWDISSPSRSELNHSSLLLSTSFATTGGTVCKIQTNLHVLSPAKTLQQILTVDHGGQQRVHTKIDTVNIFPLRTSV